MKNWKQHIMGDTNIYIALMTMGDPLDEKHDYAKYNIMHGRRSSVDGGLLCSHYITGKDEYGREKGFQSIDDVEKFIEEELNEIKTMEDHNPPSLDMVKNNPDCRYKTNREEIIAAWTEFQRQFLIMRKEGMLVLWEDVNENK